MAKEFKVDLSLLNSFVKAVNDQIDIVEKLRAEEGYDPHALIVELSKTMGVLTSLSSESLLLVGDISRLIGQNSIPGAGAGIPSLESLLGSLGVKNKN